MPKNKVPLRCIELHEYEKQWHVYIGETKIGVFFNKESADKFRRSVRDSLEKMLVEEGILDYD